MLLLCLATPSMLPLHGVLCSSMVKTERGCTLGYATNSSASSLTSIKESMLHVNLRICACKGLCTRMRTFARTRMHTFTYSLMYTQTHTHTYTHKHTYQYHHHH